jgi:hypothetical protein
MKITIHHVLKLIKILDKGIIHGAGETVEEFCVQQAVHRVLLDDPEDAYASDNPPNWCILDQIRAFGIHLNDQGGWKDNRSRARGLKRFAIAELGSSKLNSYEFFTKLRGALARRTGADPAFFCDGDCIIDQFMELDRRGLSRNDWLTVLADTAADVMKELGSEGAQFLYLVDEPDKAKRHEKATRLGHQIFAAQLAEERCRWGLDSDYGLPIKGHHHPKLPVAPKQ